MTLFAAWVSLWTGVALALNPVALQLAIVTWFYVFAAVLVICDVMFRLSLPWVRRGEA